MNALQKEGNTRSSRATCWAAGGPCCTPAVVGRFGGLRDVFTLKGMELAEGLTQVVIGDLVVFDVETVEDRLV